MDTSTGERELQELGWVIFEAMGHRKLAGEAREVLIAGVVVLRIDVPGDPAVTQFYGGASIFCITPIDEATGRRLAAAWTSPAPVSRYELPAATGGLTLDSDYYINTSDGDDE